MSVRRRIVTIGGNEDKRAGRGSILERFAVQAGGRGAHVAVVPSASVEPEQRGEMYRRIFTRLGCEVSIVRPDLHSDAHQVLSDASGIFITGGDQQRLMDVLEVGAAGMAIAHAVNQGAIYAGTSAGASAASRSMISSSKRERRQDRVTLGRGLGLIPQVIIDQHFSERRRLPRLMRAVEASGMPGVGVDENTALVWSSNVSFTVFGAGTATVVESADRVGDFSVRVLEPGMSYDFEVASMNYHSVPPDELSLSA